MKNTHELLESVTDKIRSNVATCVELFSSVRWKKVSFTIPMTPKPSARPRLSGYRVYVPHAAQNATFFNKYVLPKLNGLFITTPCKFKLDIYVATPASFTKTQRCLAEMKILRPWVSTGDVDNYSKAAMDMVQPNEKRGHVGIMSNDCLVLDLTASKYYSVTPRYEVTITYMDKIPNSIMKILKIKGDD